MVADSPRRSGGVGMHARGMAAVSGNDGYDKREEMMIVGE